MATDREYYEFIMERLALVPELSGYKMMGEYVLYSQKVVFGGIYDDRFLVKDTPQSRAMLKVIREEIPYPGAKKMLLVEDLDDSEFLSRLAVAVAQDVAKNTKVKNNPKHKEK